MKKDRRKRERNAEAAEAEEYAKELGLDGQEDSLTKAIMQRQVGLVQNKFTVEIRITDHSWGSNSERFGKSDE